MSEQGRPSWPILGLSAFAWPKCWGLSTSDPGRLSLIFADLLSRIPQPVVAGREGQDWHWRQRRLSCQPSPRAQERSLHQEAQHVSRSRNSLILSAWLFLSVQLTGGCRPGLAWHRASDSSSSEQESHPAQSQGWAWALSPPRHSRDFPPSLSWYSRVQGPNS